MDDWTTFFDRSPGEGLISRGNRVEHLPHDNSALLRMWDAIDRATKRVWMSMFTLGADAVGLGTIGRLTEAAGRGCDVRLVYDYIGSLGLREHHTAQLTEAGGHVVIFNRPWPPWKRNGPLAIRNHRKLVIIDDDEAFCGGMNLSTDFADPRQDGTKITFDDTSVRVNGPCVLDLAGVFRHTWDENTGEDPRLPPRSDPYPDGIPVAVLQTDPRRPETELIEILGGAISRTSQLCRITTPYFVPAPWLINAIKEVLGQGARVEIVTAGRTDANVAKLAGRHCYGDLLECGARIFEMHGRIIHTKKLIVDGIFCAVGSYNFDVWTSRHVLDCSIAAIDRRLAHSFEKEFEEDVYYSKEITLARWKRRPLISKAASWAALQVCAHV